jgi:hypothetical protein
MIIIIGKLRLACQHGFEVQQACRTPTVRPARFPGHRARARERFSQRMALAASIRGHLQVETACTGCVM